MIQKYHVYILGAGASYHAGLPILSDFFDKAETLCEGNKARQPACSGYQTAIKLVRQFRLDNKKSCQPQNIEDVYRLALEFNDTEVLEALEKVVLGVLDLNGCLVNYDGKKYRPDSVYESFVEKLFPYEDGVWARRKNVDNTVIITFNWDCLIDYAMFYHTMGPYYGVGQYSKTNTPKLLKMHGSINWGVCRACASAIKITPPNDFVGTRFIEEPVEFDLRVVTEGLGRQKCNCGKNLSPKIIPPAYRKDLSGDITHIWDAAGEFLEKAHKITLIGYSFPKTDTDFLGLVQKALDNTIDLMKIEVVNPSCANIDFQNNYKDIFCKHPSKMTFCEQRFEDYIYQIKR